jgi:hypothetical protein
MGSLCAGEGIDFCRALDDLCGMAVSPEGNLIFCCDAPVNNAVIGSLKKNSLQDLIQKGLEISNHLKEIRKDHIIYKQSFFEGFNTCVFCNEYLRKK